MKRKKQEEEIVMPSFPKSGVSSKTTDEVQLFAINKNHLSIELLEEFMTTVREVESDGFTYVSTKVDMEAPRYTQYGQVGNYTITWRGIR